ncbi:hypothetical protein M153_8120001035 [Pseudoloma neurophilia]|uniref:Uncharacterized protein n=1 Tax=Pseudoloma neurophilia TaxID=146866 RepID=A0A0R0M387_9MICR|nr:hypothetical protein M153_8120001035 [Pseudoloma neurophilia]
MHLNAKTKKIITSQEKKDDKNYLKQVKNFIFDNLIAERRADSRPFVYLRLKDKNFRALVDSGASHNFVSPSVAESMRQVVPINDHKVQLATKQTDITGKVSIEIVDKGFTNSKIDLYVVKDLSEEVFLGFTTCQDLNIKIFSDVDTGRTLYCNTITPICNSFEISHISDTDQTEFKFISGKDNAFADLISRGTIHLKTISTVEQEIPDELSDAEKQELILRAHIATAHGSREPVFLYLRNYSR